MKIDGGLSIVLLSVAPNDKCVRCVVLLIHIYDSMCTAHADSHGDEIAPFAPQHTANEPHNESLSSINSILYCQCTKSYKNYNFNWHFHLYEKKIVYITASPDRDKLGKAQKKISFCFVSRRINKIFCRRLLHNFLCTKTVGFPWCYQRYAVIDSLYDD